MNIDSYLMKTGLNKLNIDKFHKLNKDYLEKTKELKCFVEFGKGIEQLEQEIASKKLSNFLTEMKIDTLKKIRAIKK